jgi:hypothetical protein
MQPVKPNESYYCLWLVDPKGLGNWVGLESKQLEPDKPYCPWN